jgi:hypothetical protein
MDGNAVPVLELKVRRFVSHALDLCLAVGDHSGGEAADLGGDGEYVGDGLRVHESVGDFFLGDDDAGVFAAEGDAGQSRGGGGGFEGVFHLVESSLGGEDGYMVIIVAVICRYYLSY